eukprot:5176136-Pleurochrysis_carterae.AAC.3
MHSLPFCTRVACVLAERSRSAPQVLEYCSRWLPLPRELPFLEPPPRRAPPPAPALLPEQWSLVSYTNNHFPARLLRSILADSE